MKALISQESAKAGIDPRVMEGIRAGESGHGSRYDKKDDSMESSWGPFQLNRRRGLGQDFERDTGLDVRNPSTIAAQARWVANYIKKHHGTNRQWMGYHGLRNADPRWGNSGYVPGRSGIAARAAGGPVSRGQPYVVGENGPELFIPAKSGGISKLPKAVQRQIGPYQGLLKNMPKGDYVRGGGLPWDVPSDRNDITPSETGERIMQELLKKHYKDTIGKPWTQKRLEELESNKFQRNWDDGHEWPGPNASPKIRSVDLGGRGLQKVTGSASLRIALENFPKGTRTTAKIAGMFKDINVDRGHAAPWAAG